MSSKKDNELSVIQIFEELSGFAVCKSLVKTESPDFISQIDQKTIGIEVTEIYQGSNKGSLLKQQSSYKEHFTEILMLELKKHLSYNFGIDVDIDFTVPVKKSSYASIIQDIISICYPHLKDLTGDYTSKEFESYRDNLPDSINSITVTRIEGLVEPHNFQSEAGVIPVLTNSDVDKVVQKKEVALKKFQECDEYWLIIREGNYHSGSFGRQPDFALPLVSKFDKVYLLRTNYRELILLT